MFHACPYDVILTIFKNVIIVAMSDPENAVAAVPVPPIFETPVLPGSVDVPTPLAPESEGASLQQPSAPEPGSPAGFIRSAIARIRLGGSALEGRIKAGLATEMSRREFLGDTAGASIALGAVATYGGQGALANYLLNKVDKAMDKEWPDNKPSFTVIGEMPEHPKDLAIFLPGFGDTQGEHEAEFVRSVGEVDPKLPMGYLNYSNEGATIEQLAEAIRSKVDVQKLESLTLVCRSLGGPYAINLAAELGVPVRNIVFMSSPFDISDGDFASIGADLAGLPNMRLTDTSIKYVMNVWDDAKQAGNDNPFDVLRDQLLTLFEAFGGTARTAPSIKRTLQAMDQLGIDSARAWTSVMLGASPIALQQELRTWKQEGLSTDPRDISSSMLRKYRHVFIPGYTHVLYTSTDHPSTDETVVVLTSAHHIWQFFHCVVGLHPGDIDVEGLPYNGHADVWATMPRIRPWIERQTQAQLSLTGAPILQRRT